MLWSYWFVKNINKSLRNVKKLNYRGRPLTHSHDLKTELQFSEGKFTLPEIFMKDFLAEKAPCFGLNYIEVDGKIKGAFILRPNKFIPPASTDQGFCFGHSVLGFGESTLFQFVFHFYNHATFNALVSLESVLAQSVLYTMTRQEEYFFLSFNPDETVTAFKSTLKEDDLKTFKTNFDHFQNTPCPPEDYDYAVARFTENPKPAGEIMTWVCRDNLDYLDLNGPQRELTLKIDPDLYSKKAG
tara:strand:+ start:627 stop:1352 length:726 start_codon:yes stop_codon:yes gene_type:complete